MLLTPKVTFVGFDPSVLLRQLVARRIAGLERFDGRILSCTVVVEPLGMGLDAGHPVRVHVIVILPGPDISVSRDSGQGPFPRDLRALDDLHHSRFPPSLRKLILSFVHRRDQGIAIG